MGTPIANASVALTPTERATAAYLGLAIGDALGATVEFMTPREIQVQYGVHDSIRGEGWLKLRPGQVTDDTTMSLALGKAILAAGCVDAMAMANGLDGWMRAKPVDIGNTVRRGLQRFRATGSTISPISEHDAGNGAAMRVLPVALATFGAPEIAVREACRTQAHITHNNPLSDAATECFALMVQDAMRGFGKDHLYERHACRLVAEYPVFAFENAKDRMNPSGYIVDTAQAVFQSLFGKDGFRATLVDVVNRGGDADTTGAIAGMLAGAIYGIESIPVTWLENLDSEVESQCRLQARDLCRLGLAACS